MKKDSKRNLAIISMLMIVLRVSAQGTFGNLNFESANPVPLVGSSYYPYAVATSNGIPQWTAYLGANTVGEIFMNTVSIGAAAVSLQTSTSTAPPIAGSYSVLLQSSVGVNPTTAAVGQTGQIPSSSMSLRFYGATVMQVTFAGQLLSLFEIGSGPSYQIVGADISAFAGQTGELKFLMPRFGPVGNMSASYLDNIQFSNQPIPEPSAFSLFGLGALLFSYRSHRVSKL